MKENNKQWSCCHRLNCFEYYGNEKALCGRIVYEENDEWKGEYFIPERIQVIQMYETEEQKRIREEKEEVNKKQIEEMTQMKMGETLFDSNVDNWSKDTSVLSERIIGKKQIVFMIEDSEGEIFGYYLNSEIFKNIKYEKWINTD